MSTVQLIINYMQENKHICFNSEMLHRIFNNRGIKITDKDIKEASNSMIDDLFKKYNIRF